MSFTNFITQLGAAGSAGGVPFAYVASSQSDSLEIFDISDPANMVHVGSTGTLAELDGASEVSVDVANSVAYVTCASEYAITSIDVSDPTSPSLLGSIVDITFYNGANKVYIDTSTGTAFSTGSGNSADFTTTNISNPASMVRLDTVSSSMDNAQDVAVDLGNSLAHVVATNNKLLMTVNISNLSSLSEVRSTNTNLLSPSAVALMPGATDYLYVLDQSNNAINVYNASNLAYHSRYLNSILNSPKDGVIDTVNSRYYAVNTTGGFFAFDISGITPTLTSSFTDATNIGYGFGLCFDPKTNVVYVANITGSKLTSVDVSNPASMSVLDSVTTNLNFPRGVAINVTGTSSSREL